MRERGSEDGRRNGTDSRGTADGPVTVDGLSPRSGTGDRAGADDTAGGHRRLAALLAAGLVAVAIVVLAALGFWLSVVGLGMDNGKDSVTPRASFDFEYDTANGTVTIRHVGGVTYDSENTAAVRVVGTESGAVERPSLPVSAGDYLVGGFPVESGGTVRVVYVPPHRDWTNTLATYEVPGSDDDDAGWW